jgi:hypothetical protein
MPQTIAHGSIRHHGCRAVALAQARFLGIRPAGSLSNVERSAHTVVDCGTVHVGDGVSHCWRPCRGSYVHPLRQAISSQVYEQPTKTPMRTGNPAHLLKLADREFRHLTEERPKAKPPSRKFRPVKLNIHGIASAALPCASPLSCCGRTMRRCSAPCAKTTKR